MDNKIINQDFFKKTIFIISSPQEAAGLLLLSKDLAVDYCILIKYIDYADKIYADITKRVLDEVNIKNLLILDLYLHNVSMNQGNIYLTFKQIYLNKLIINKFNKEKFHGDLFDNNYNFVAQFYSPILTLGNYDLNKIYLMEHSPTDSRDRLIRLKNKENIFNKKSLRLVGRVDLSSIKLQQLFLKVKKKILRAVVLTLFPYMKELCYLKKGFSWVDYDDNFILMDYRNLKFNIEFSVLREGFYDEPKTLLLIEHKEAFIKVDALYKEMKEIDFVEMYADILKKHVGIDESIVCKLHPYVLQNANKLDVKNYSDRLKACFLSIGYKKVTFLDEILQGELTHLMPVEMLLRPLKVNKMVGLYSSAMLIVQHWDGMMVISDCSWIKYFGLLRSMDKEIFNMKLIQA